MLTIYHIFQTSHKQSQAQSNSEANGVLKELYHTQSRDMCLLCKIFKRNPHSLPPNQKSTVIESLQWSAPCSNTHRNQHVETDCEAVLPKTVLDSVSQFGVWEFAYWAGSHRMLILPVHIPHSEDKVLGNTNSIFFLQFPTRRDTSFLHTPKTFLA